LRQEAKTQVKNPLKIVFAGTPDFAALHLQALVESEHDVIAVYSQPDRPAGRGKKLLAINKDDTSDSLYQKLAEIGPLTLLETLTRLTELQLQTQDDELASYAKKLSKEEAKIDWNLPAEQLERNIRAFNPWPVAFFILNNANVKVYLSDVVENENPEIPVGQIVKSDKNGILVTTGDGCLLLTKLQLPGKKPMSAADVLNGRADWFAVGVSLI
jgi:methionyl-tRNA formyltransferase